MCLDQGQEKLSEEEGLDYVKVRDGGTITFGINSGEDAQFSLLIFVALVPVCSK